jgi:hypothetical protein
MSQRRRRVLIGAGAVLLLTLAGGAGYYIYFRTATEHELAELVANLDRDEPGWKQGDLDRKRFADLPAGQNSVPLFVKLQAQLPAGWNKQDPEEDWRDLPPGEPLPDQQAAILRAHVAKVGKLLPEVRRLVDLPPGRFTVGWTPDMISTLMPHSFHGREVADLLLQDAYFQTHRHDRNGALVSCRAIVPVARLFDDEPTMISQLVRRACLDMAVQAVQHILAAGAADEASLASLQKALEDADTKDGFRMGMRGERAAMHELFTNLENGSVSLGTMMAVLGARSPSGITVLDKAGELAMKSSVPTSHVWILRHLNEVIEASQLPAAECSARLKALDEDAPSAPLLAKHLSGAAWGRFHEGFERNHVRMRCAMIAIAAERYRIQHGRWPADLDALAPQFLAELPTDPYTDKAFKLRRVGSDFVVFTGGPDGNHKGDYYDRVPPQFPLAGLPPGTVPGSNYEFRLWSPARRGLPLAERLK